MNQFGPSGDCPDCGQAINPNDWRNCPTCGDQLCYSCMGNHVCTKCAACSCEVNKAEGKYLEEYMEWVCGADCHIEFLTQLLEERQGSRLAQLAKTAATTGNVSDLRAYLRERRSA